MKHALNIIKTTKEAVKEISKGTIEGISKWNVYMKWIAGSWSKKRSHTHAEKEVEVTEVLQICLELEQHKDVFVVVSLHKGCF